MATLILKSPLAGWALPIEEIPDPVFAQRMAGDGMALDPTSNLLHAPCDATVVSVAGTRHAVTLQAGSAQLLLHVGIDTVGLQGAGFEALVRAGDSVACGQPLLRFDLELVARRAPSLVTPMLVVGGGRLLRCTTQRLVAVGDEVMEIALESAPDETADDASDAAVIRREFVVPFEHGLHARPAAQLAAALQPFAAKVRLRFRDNSANARSTIAVMALGAACNDRIEASAVGADAEAALDALARLLSAPVAEESPAPAVLAGASTSTDTGLRGVIASRGLALGPATFLLARKVEITDSADDPALESKRLDAAIDAVQARMTALLETLRGDEREILDAHAQLVRDPELLEQAGRSIAAGRSAGRAWQLAIAASTQVLGRLEDARMRERVADLRDIEQQVLSALAGRESASAMRLPENAILLADELLPSQLIGLDRSRVAGICTARGGPTSHVAIIASALGIPALVALGSRVLDIRAGSTVVLDAERGRLELAPGATEQARIVTALGARRGQQAADLAAAHESARTRDGLHVRVCANLGAVEEASVAVAQGADGCGLLRTEFLYLHRHTPPGEDEQFEQYRQIRDRLAPRPLTIRTMDIGGDKPIPYLPLPPEENPALGLRGLRTSLARPQLLRTQLRAILRLGSTSGCRILMPMVTDASDLLQVRQLLRECADELGVAQLPPLGAMVETPASALLAGQLLDHADFLSIGTNDLSQYVLAMDRAHPLLAARLDALHPAVLRLLGSVAVAGEARGREVAVCGGLGSDPEAIALLIGLGIHEVSAVPAAIPELKRIVRSLDSQACRALALRALDLPDAAAVRRLVAEWTTAATELESAR